VYGQCVIGSRDRIELDYFIRALNAFIEDTCVLVAVAFLLARGRMLALLFRERRTPWESLYLGVVLGIIGVTEEAFPGARTPYLMDSLMVTFAALTGGPVVSLVTVVLITAVALLLRGLRGAAWTVLGLAAVALLGEALRRAADARHRLPAGFATGLLTQSAVALIQLPMLKSGGATGLLGRSAVAIMANGFGTMLLLLVANDARLRADSVRNRSEAQAARALVTEAQLNALRARVHPHFLFNALTSIAALCIEAPARAEAATVRLGQLMRRVLEISATTPLCLSDELSHVQGYLEMEQLRLGDRLSVSWQVDPACNQIRLPPFAIQTLVENAVLHGISPQVGPGKITVTIRRFARHVLVAVADTGVGMTADQRCQAMAPTAARLHGLQILTQQLTMLYGPRARVRLISQIDEGTVAAFRVPAEDQGVLKELAGIG